MSSEEDRLKEEEMASEGDSIGFKVPSLPSSPAGNVETIYVAQMREF